MAELTPNFGLPIPSDPANQLQHRAVWLAIDAALFAIGLRTPTQDEKDALVGVGGTPNALNRYVTDSDARLSPLVIDWMFRVMTAGGTVSTSTYALIGRLVEDLSLVGLREKILRLNLRCGSNLAACLVPLIADFGDATDTNNNFVEADYAEIAGLDPGDTGTKYLDTGFNPSTAGLSLESASMGMFILNSAPDGLRWAMGCFDGTNQFSLLPLSSGEGVFCAFDFGGDGRIARTQIDTFGLLAGSRIADDDGRLFKNGQQVLAPFTDVPTSEPPDLSVYIFGYNDNDVLGGVGDPSTHISGGDFIGLGMTNQDMANLYLILKAFNEGLGRLTTRITTDTLPDGTETEVYAETLTAWGRDPITWDISAGALPDGLSLSSDGEITGTPTVIDDFTFTVRATSPESGIGTKEFTVTVNAPVAFGDPTDIPGLMLWLDAGSLSLSNNDPVPTWADSSAEGNDAAQATSGKRPIYKTNIINSLPVVRFDGADDVLELTTNLDLPEFSIFMVIKKASAGSGYHVPITFKQAPTFARTPSLDEWGMYVSGEISGGASVNAFKVLSIVARAANDIDFVTDGSLVNRTSGSAYLTGTRSLIGANTAGASEQHWLDGDIAEIVVYDSALSTGDRTDVEDYLATKYAL